MASTSMAAVFQEAGRPLVLEEFPLPRLAAGEVLVRVTCSTLCGSDVHTYLGHRLTPVPTVLGHEILGVVDAIGASHGAQDYHGRQLAIGDRVTWSVAASCGDCFYCGHELPQKCDNLFKYGHEPIVAEHPLSGGLAEYCHLARGTAIISVPGDLDDRVACPANCATATVAAALRAGRLQRGDMVLVQGSGMLGLTAAAMARSRGAEKVIACDVDPRRLGRAEEFGATDTLLVSDDNRGFEDAIEALTSGRGVDLALELSGSVSALQSGIGRLRIGGRYVLVGSIVPSPAIELDPESVVRRMLTIVGVHNYRPEDLAEAIEFLASHSGQYPFQSLVGDRFPLAQADAAFAAAAAGDSFRVAVAP